MFKVLKLRKFVNWSEKFGCILQLVQKIQCAFAFRLGKSQQYFKHVNLLDSTVYKVHTHHLESTHYSIQPNREFYN